jgi:hypothetical protein
MKRTTMVDRRAPATTRTYLTEREVDDLLHLAGEPPLDPAQRWLARVGREYARLRATHWRLLEEAVGKRVTTPPMPEISARPEGDRESLAAYSWSPAGASPSELFVSRSAALMPPHRFTEILRHELAHEFCAALGVEDDHGRTWRRCARALGLRPPTW